MSKQTDRAVAVTTAMDEMKARLEGAGASKWATDRVVAGVAFGVLSTGLDLLAGKEVPTAFQRTEGEEQLLGYIARLEAFLNEVKHLDLVLAERARETVDSRFGAEEAVGVLG